MPHKHADILSIYRGQADSGLGDGPDIPISFGEQFLHGTANELYTREDKLLSTIRPWLTLDSKPEDHRQKQLEAWSCFSEKGRFFAARMVFAGYHDRRVAYFCHARSWPVDLVEQTHDPGLCLGCSAMFDEPDRRGTSDQALKRLPNLPVELWKPVLEIEKQTAIRFLGHLVQTMDQNDSPPLLIGVPLNEFSQGSPLFSLIAYARAALPARLKPACSIRIHTRQPENFIRRLSARLIVLPEDSLSDALNAQANSTLLNRQGECKMGRRLASHYEEYASVLTEYVLRVPKGVMPFSGFWGFQRKIDPPIRPIEGESKINSTLIRLSYLLAMDLADQENKNALEEFFCKVLRNQSESTFRWIGLSGEDWDGLLKDDEWGRFPKKLLAEFALTPRERLRGADEQNLQATVTKVLGRLGGYLDEPLAKRWASAFLDEETERLELNRLLQLLEYTPSPISENALQRHIAPKLSMWALRHPSDLDQAGQDFQAIVEDALKRQDLTLDNALADWLQSVDPVDVKEDRLKFGRILELWKDKGLITDEAMRNQTASMLRELVLAPTKILGVAHMGGLQAEADHALSRLGLALDDALKPWLEGIDPFNNTDDLHKLNRILTVSKKNLISDEVMRKQAAPVLRTFVLAPSSNDKFYQLIQKNTEETMNRLDLKLDDALDGWPRDGGQDRRNKLKRMLELLEKPHTNSLFGERLKLANRTRSVPLSEWSETQQPLGNLIKLELNARLLSKRPPADLAKLAQERSNFKILVSATKAGQLDAQWACVFVNQAHTENELRILLDLAGEILESRAAVQKWGAKACTANIGSLASMDWFNA